ncbi:MAG: gamma-glutamyl-gamma-aminobutyrate hydrolase family protein [Verrucomicrobiota bacterium]
MNLLVVDCGSKKVGEIVQIVKDEHFSPQIWPFEKTPKIAKAIIISGGPHLFTNEDESKALQLQKRFAWVRNVQVPVLGICLGHQALALADGAEVYRGPERRDSDAIQLSGDHPILSGIPSGTEFAEDHCEGVTPPPSFQVLGSSADYPVEIIANDEKLQYGVQFHPEVSGEMGRRIIANFLKLVSDANSSTS